MGLNTTVLIDQSVDDDLSNAFNSGEGIVGKLTTPAALTGTALTFTYCPTQGGTYLALYDKTNTQVSLTIAVDRAYDLPPEVLGIGWVKLVSNDNEAADRTFGIQLGP